MLSCRCAQSRSTYWSTPGHAGDDRAGSQARLLERERRQRAEPALLPQGQRQQRRAASASAERQQRPQVARQRAPQRSGAATKSPFDGFTPIAKPTTRPAASCRACARVSSARMKRRAPTSSEDHRLEVDEAGEAERAGQELLDVALVVVAAPERDHGERQHDPDGGGQEAESPPGDPRRQAVDRPEGERAEHEHVEARSPRGIASTKLGPVSRMMRCEQRAASRSRRRSARTRRPPSSQPVVISQIWSPPW